MDVPIHVRNGGDENSLSVAVTRGPRRIFSASFSSSPIFTSAENARPSGDVVW